MTTLPPDLQACLAKFSRVDLLPGRLGDRVYRLWNGGRVDSYLKYAEAPKAVDALRAETDRLIWLDGLIAAPRVLRFFDFDLGVALHMTALDGLPAHHEQNTPDPKRLIQLLIEGMSIIHRIPARNCPFEDQIDITLTEIAAQVSQQTVDRAKFAQATGGDDPARALAQLLERRPHLHAGTFIHGDYCLPNVLVKDGRLAGFVDWGYAGLGDPCRDSVSCAQSISFNLGAEWVEHYHDACGSLAKQGGREAFFKSLDVFESCFARVDVQNG